MSDLVIAENGEQELELVLEISSAAQAKAKQERFNKILQRFVIELMSWVLLSQ